MPLMMRRAALLLACIAAHASLEPPPPIPSQRKSHPSHTSLSIVICDPLNDPSYLHSLLGQRLPYLHIYAFAESPDETLCQGALCKGCSFLILHGDGVHSGRTVRPVYGNESKLAALVYPLLAVEVVINSQIDADAMILFRGAQPVEKTIAELKAFGNVVVNSIPGDTLIVRSMSGVELLRHQVDARRDEVYVTMVEDPCDRANAVQGDFVCSKPADEDVVVKAPPKPAFDVEGLDPEKAVTAGITPQDTTIPPQFIMTAPGELLRDLRMEDWAERQEVKMQQYKYGERYSDVGFRVATVAPAAREALAAAHATMLPGRVIERWPATSVLLNHWAARTHKIHLGEPVKALLEVLVRREVEEWLGLRVRVRAISDVRQYTDGCIISYHVDQAKKHHFTAIVNVAQDVEEPWAFHVFDHSDELHEVYVEPGEMILLESSSCVHGRAEPLVGNSYSNVFVHFDLV